MDTFSFSTLPLVAVLAISLAYLFLTKKLRKGLPPSPLSIPFVGHILYLKKPLHRTFESLSQKYGPIFSLRVGSRLIVIVSSPSLVQECMGQNDAVFANRPRFLNSKYVAYDNTTVGTAPYGPHWRNLRRITTTEMVSSNRLAVFRVIREAGVHRMVAKLARATTRSGGSDFVRVDMWRVISELVMNNIMMMIAGKKYFNEDDDVVSSSKDESSTRFHAIMLDVIDKSGVGNPADYFPVLKLISPKYVNQVKELGFRMNEFTQGLLDETRERKKKEEHDSMLDHLLKLQEEQPEHYSDQTIKGLVQTMMLAGTDTSIAVLTWAISSLLNHPHILQKAREQIDNLVGPDRLLDESDLPNLPYLNCIIQETFRLYPPVPFLLPHFSSGDTTIGGYHVPRDTVLLVNTWAIQRDPTVWPDPEVFRPERFEGRLDKIDQYSLIPFGVGRRACPGANMSLKSLPPTLGAFIQCFDWKTVDGVPVDMTEGQGLVMHKAERLAAMCRARPVAHKAKPRV